MQPSITPFETFLRTYGVRPDLSRRALDLIRPVIDRLEKGAWPLLPASELQPDEVLRTFNECFGMDVPEIEIVSRSALLDSRSAFAAVVIDMIPVDVELCEEAFEKSLELRLTAEMETRFGDAIMAAIDPDDSLRGPLTDLVQDVPTEFGDGLTIGILMPFSCVAVAAVGDDKLLERIVPGIRLTQRCLFLGFKNAERRTLLVLAD